MNEQQINRLMSAMTAQTEALAQQTQAINRLAESNENLISLIMQSLDEEIPNDEAPLSTYLNGKPLGG